MKEIVAISYTNDVLQRLYSLYLVRYCALHQREIEQAMPAYWQFSKKMKKAQLIDLVAGIFSSRELFSGVMSALPQDVAKTFSILVWEGIQKVGELEKKVSAQILVPPKEEGWRSYYYEYMKNVRGPYLFFCFQAQEYFSYQRNFSPDRYNIFLPDTIRRVLKTFLTPPEGYNLVPVDTTPQTGFVYRSEGEVFTELPLYYEYIRQGHMQLAGGSKPSKAALRQLKQSSAAREFYETRKDLDLIKTTLMVALIRTATKAEKPKDPLELLKQVFGTFSALGGGSFSLDNLLFHLKCKAGAHGYLPERKKVNALLFSLLKELPSGGWISIENLVRFIVLRDIDLAPADASFASRYLYFTQVDRYEHKVFIEAQHYQEAVITPLIKGSMFLFAAFGLVDIAYDFPVNEALKQKGEEYLSVFDGAKYVQLTELGAYITGRTCQYTMPVREEKAAEIILDPNRLIITIYGEDRLKSMILEKFATQISRNHYKVDYASFLRECFSEQDIKRRIKLFKTEIASKPPQVWLDFFGRVLSRIHPLTHQETMKVFKLSPDKELIHLVATDSILRKYILKADNYHIIVEESNFPKVRQRLESLGYLI